MRKEAVASCRKWLWMYVRSTPWCTAAVTAAALTTIAKKPGGRHVFRYKYTEREEMWKTKDKKLTIHLNMFM